VSHNFLKAGTVTCFGDTVVGFEIL